MSYESPTRLSSPRPLRRVGAPDVDRKLWDVFKTDCTHTRHSICYFSVSNSGMNEEHLRICSSPEWAQYVERELLPWALRGTDLGDHVLEIGAGPGLTTDVLSRRVPRLTAVEVDPGLAAALASRVEGSNVTVVCADGVDLPFPNGCFSAASMFTMLHHVPSVGRQNELLAEVRRVLSPGGVVVGSDSCETTERWLLHQGDAYVPIDPAAFAPRLSAAGFVDIIVEEHDDRFKFLGRAPARAA